jgi:hypothetical protein
LRTYRWKSRRSPVAALASGAIACYPVYSQLLGSDLAEATEVCAAIARGSKGGLARTANRAGRVVPASSAIPLRWERRPHVYASAGVYSRAVQNVQQKRGVQVNVIIKRDLRSVPSAVPGPSNNNPDSMIRSVRPLTTYYLGRPAQLWVDALARRRPVAAANCLPTTQARRDPTVGVEASFRGPKLISDPPEP